MENGAISPVIHTFFYHYLCHVSCLSEYLNTDVAFETDKQQMRPFLPPSFSPPKGINDICLFDKQCEECISDMCVCVCVDLRGMGVGG